MAKGAEWFDGAPKFFANKASAAATKAATTGNKIYGHIADISNQMAQRYADEAASILEGSNKNFSDELHVYGAKKRDNI